MFYKIFDKPMPEIVKYIFEHLNKNDGMYEKRKIVS